MSDKQNNLANDMLRAWQDHLQNTLQDQRVSELMVEQYSKIQDIFKGHGQNENSSESSNSTVPNDVDVKLAYFADRLEAMEARLTLIEKAIAGSGNTGGKRS